MKGQQFCLLRQFCEIVVFVFAASVMPFPSWMQSSQDCGPQINLFAVVLRTVFFPGLAFHFGIDAAALGIGSEGTTKEKNVGFGAVAVRTNAGMAETRRRIGMSSGREGMQ